MWIKNTDGKPDAMLTFATISFMAVTLNVMLSTIGQISIGGSIIEFQPLDSTTMGVYLAATFTAYVSRRLTDRHYVDEGKAKKKGGDSAPLE
jgi:hypothetical protein